MNWNKSEIDYEVVKSFIPKDDLDCFLVFENIYFNTESIIAPYRTLLGTEGLIISKSEYISRIRDIKIENVLNG
jgi:hypothetical protein